MKSKLTLRVIKGKHAGATQVLDQKAFIIGSSLEADIVLTDPLVLSRHAKFTPASSTIELQALEGEIVFEGRTVPPGGRIQTHYPLSVALGEAELEMISAPENATPSIPLIFKIGGLATLGVIVAANVYFDMPKTGAIIPAITQNRVSVAAMTAPVKPAGTDGAIAKAAADALREHLLSLSIDTITIKPGDGTVSAIGTIEPQRKNDWQSSQILFDEKFGQHVILQSDVSTAPKKQIKAPIAIQSVWCGKFPYIIDSEGNKLFEGSTLRDGWVVDKIEENGILISKDKEPLLLKY